MFSALNASVSGVRAQDTAMSSISGNIANVSSTGYKGVYTAFKTMVNNEYYYGSGVMTKPHMSVTVSGFIEDTGIVTDLAVQGEGMFAVNSSATGKGEMLYTREGSFRKDKFGNLLNIGGAYLMAWSLLEKGQSESANKSETRSLSDLKVVNLNEVLNDVVPTDNIRLGMNLDAKEKIATGMNYNIKADTGFTIEDIIYDKNLRIGDGFSITTNEQKYDFNYGGFTASNNININKILGANNINDYFSALKNGDNFAIKTKKLGEVKFTYHAIKPDIKNGEFNSLVTLKDAITSTGEINASITDGVLCIAPKNSDDFIHFINGVDVSTLGSTRAEINTAYGEKQFYDVIHSVDMDKEEVYGINPIDIDKPQQIFKSAAGATNGDGIVITTDTGNKYEFFYNESLSTNPQEFNNLQTLANSINANSQEELKATINGDLMTIEQQSGCFITSIANLNKVGKSNFATTLKLAIETQFAEKAVNGDKITIAFGSYNDVTATNDKKGIYKDKNALFGSFITGIDFATDEAFGVTNRSANPITHVFKIAEGAQNNDGIEITMSDGNTMQFLYNEAGGSDKFNSLKSLVDLINKDTANNIEARLNNYSITIAAKNPNISQISSIKDLTDSSNIASPANFATHLKLNKVFTNFATGIDFSTDSAFGITSTTVNPTTKVFQTTAGAKNDDGIEIMMSDGTKEILKYNEVSGNTTFNSLKSLADLINSKTQELGITAQIDNNRITIQSTNPSKQIAFITDFTGTTNTANPANFASNLELYRVFANTATGINFATDSAFGIFPSDTDPINKIFSTAAGATENDGIKISIDGQDFTFKYKENSPGTEEFNSLKSLADAINNTAGTLLEAKIINKSISISLKDPNKAILSITDDNISGTSSFATNLKLKISTGSSIEGIDLTTETAFGVTQKITDPTAETFSTGEGATNGDGIQISLNGQNLTFTYKENSPDFSAKEFNSLKTLVNAINATNELKAKVVNQSIAISAKDPNQSISEITNLNSNGSSNFADKLKLKISHGNVVQGIDLKSDNAFGVTSNITDSTTAIFSTADGAVNGDGIKVVTSTGQILTYIYDENGKPNSFNSLKSLADLINDDTSSEIAAKINNKSIELSFKDSSSSQVLFIEDFTAANNDNPANFATKLKLKSTNMPKPGDQFSIQMTNNATYKLKFTGINNGSADEGQPDYKIGEFNNTETLIQALDFVSKGELIGDVEDNTLHIKANPNRSVHTINAIKNDNSAHLANYLGIEIESKVLDFEYIDKFYNESNENFHLPNTKKGQFNNMATLRRAINELSNATLKSSFDEPDLKQMNISVENGGKIYYIGDNNINGNSNFASTLTLDGYNIVDSLGFENIESGKNRFAKISDISFIVNDTIPSLTATVSNSNGPNQSIDITTNSVLDEVKFENFPDKYNNDELNDELDKTITDGDFLTKLGLNDYDSGPKYIANDIIDPENPNYQLKNMASGNIKPHFTSNIKIVDSLGIDHNLAMSFLKIGVNKWVAEIYATNSEDVNNGRTDGLVAYADLDFNGDGKIQNIKFQPIEGSSSTDPEEQSMNITWNSGANPSTVIMNFGLHKDSSSEDKEIAIRQLSGDYEINVMEQNGIGIGTLKRIDIDEDGIITAGFTNGSIKQIYQIPLVTFYNPDGLSLLTGNLYAESSNSGLKQVHKAGKSEVGLILSSSLEAANVELTKELTKMIPVQHAYQANSRVIQVINKLLEELHRIFS